jgi:quinol-cytochrome oxidoreductase complex cytochrome b subunit
VVPQSIHDFFLASGSVAGALIGLLFVAISVASERLSQAEAGAQLHRVRAAAALTAFLNALSVSLFALVPGHKIGPAAFVVGITGLAFVAGALLSLIRRHEVRASTVHDPLFLVGLMITFVIQLVVGASVIAKPDNPGAVNTIAVLVIVCFLIGIARAWELIGGPSVAFTQEVAALVRSRQRGDGEEPAQEESP